MPTDLVRRWLRQVLAPYACRDLVFQQVDSTLLAYPSLSPKTDSFTFDDGRTALLLCLSGTIAVSYRGASYNIPIAIWITHDFPQEPPIIFVTPTSDMIIRKGSHVEPGGKCIGGYLDSWVSKPEACSLTTLLEYLQDVFSREPPLYAKPKPPAPAYSSQPPPAASTSRAALSAAPQQPPRPPLPPQLSRAVSNASAVLDPQPRPMPPARPPPPPPLYSQASSSTTGSASHPYASNPGHRTQPSFPPPLNPLDPAQPGPSAHAISRSFTGNSQSYSSLDAQRPFSSVDGHPPEARRSISAFTPPLSVPPGQPSTEASSACVQQRLESLHVTDQEPSRQTQNLLDDLDDRPNAPPPATVAPPRPPNPALLSLRQAVHQRMMAELDRLDAQLVFEHKQLLILQNDLLKGEPAIVDEMARLEAVRDVCTSVGNRYEGLVGQLKARVEELRETRKTAPVDELVCSTTVLYNQLWELITDDQVIDDTIYHLARALNNSDVTRIDLDKFLKRIRALGREQFLKRCMINQISKQLGFL